MLTTDALRTALKWISGRCFVTGSYNIFPVEEEMLYVPGLDAWVGFTEDEDGRMIHRTRVFEGTSTGRVER